ncbi:flagellar biosynthetic protein FliO [Pseudomonas sp. HMWF032]|uniref:flagellar biosynthetic protein FliO n=1 Tax=unclassified Pseudomonas TaxID=196821 RepID=UPI000D35EA23|nr:MULTISPECIES: flagellar biosynthetic protein FliO [unclassified Pseudomonas]PTS82746.1 flagellar biosynthetic protein FliO [Pseudomonas sp. HMWF032]PTT72837.1 flagellar biosynthetic protein FliO [Pseudomonas sp. HMWF010]WAC43620.1 flagellar biosynthetic protein FliO [Pseudomonas sp. SL4(2022)]
MRKALFLCLLAPSVVFAAEPVTQTTAPLVGSSMGGQVVQLLLGLLLVIGLIFLLAWVMRRVQQIVPRGGQVISVLATQPLGPRDRLVLVQVGGEQVLLGLTPGTITALHVLKEPVHLPDAQPASTEFAQRLMELLGKDQKDKS